MRSVTQEVPEIDAILFWQVPSALPRCLMVCPGIIERGDTLQRRDDAMMAFFSSHVTG